MPRLFIISMILEALRLMLGVSLATLGIDKVGEFGQDFSLVPGPIRANTRDRRLRDGKTQGDEG